MDAKTFTCTAIAAVSVGVTVGLAASSVTNLHVTSAQTQAVTAAVPVMSRVNLAAPANHVVPRAAQEEVQGEYQTASNNWAVAAMASAGAAVGAAVLAMRRRATNTYEAIREDPEAVLAGAGRAMGAALIGAAVAGSANAASLTYDELQSLSYLEVKSSDLACADF